MGHLVSLVVDDSLVVNDGLVVDVLVNILVMDGLDDVMGFEVVELLSVDRHFMDGFNVLVVRLNVIVSTVHGMNGSDILVVRFDVFVMGGCSVRVVTVVGAVVLTLTVVIVVVLLFLS